MLFLDWPQSVASTSNRYFLTYLEGFPTDFRYSNGYVSVEQGLDLVPDIPRLIRILFHWLRTGLVLTRSTFSSFQRITRHVCGDREQP